MLTGTVQDATHAAVADASVSITNQLTGLHRTTHTSASGDFSLTALPVAGTYTVEASKPGFASASLEHIMLAAGSAARIAITLSVSPANTAVTVRGTANDVRIDEPQLGDRLGPVQVEETPLLNRRITFLPLLNAANRPAINQGDIFMNQELFTTNGAGRRQTWFEVDGGNAIDSWGRQTIFTNIPQDAVAEMTVLTNVFSAQFGGGTGSVVNIVTRSGSDKLHGSVLEIYRPSGPEAKLAGFNSANATSGNEITNDTLAQTAVSLSGPALPARSHATSSSPANSASSIARSPVTSPLEPGNFIGHYQDLLGFLRLDRQFSPRNNAFFRSSDDGVHRHQSKRHRRRLLACRLSRAPFIAAPTRRKSATPPSSLPTSSTISARNSNSARRSREFDPVINGTQFSVPIAGAATFISGTIQSALLMNHQYEFNDTLADDCRQTPDRLRRQRDLRAHRRRQQRVRRPHLPWQVHLQHLLPPVEHAPPSPARSLLREPGLPGQYRQRRRLQAELRQRELHGR